MAKKQVAPETPTNRSSSKSQRSKKPRSKSRSRSKVGKAANGSGAAGEELQIIVALAAREEHAKAEAVDSSEAEEVGVGGSGDEDEEELEKEPRSGKKKGNKKRKGVDDVEDAEEKGEDALYKFPMNRVSRIIKSENPDLKISQEATFVINRATEKFLQLFCREAYAYAFLDQKNHTAYNHLSSVVSKRKRFKFLSDFVPEKVKAEDALAQAQTPEAEKQTGSNLDS